MNLFSLLLACLLSRLFFWSLTGLGVQRPDALLSRIRLSALPGLSTGRRTGSSDQPRSFHLWHTHSRRNQRRHSCWWTSPCSGPTLFSLPFLSLPNSLYADLLYTHALFKQNERADNFCSWVVFIAVSFHWSIKVFVLNESTKYCTALRLNRDVQRQVFWT